jgi:tetratricopeptide (TPR) repeat protein
MCGFRFGSRTAASVLIVAAFLAAPTSIAQNDPTRAQIAALRAVLDRAATPAAANQARLSLARLLADGTSEQQQEAEVVYRQILASGPLEPALVLRSLNELGSLLLDRKETSAASDVFRRVQIMLDRADITLTRRDKARYLFNIANAQEKSQAVDSAFPLYERVLDTDPEMDEACEALADLSRRNVGTAALEAINRRVQKRDFVCSAAMVHAALTAPAWQSSDAPYARLLDQWVQHLTVSRTTIVNFENLWRDIEYHGQSERNQQKFDAVADAYGSAPGPLAIDTAIAADLVCGWSTTAAERRLFSNLLIVVSAQTPGTDRSLTRAALAWNLDRTNAAAPLAVIDTISVRPRPWGMAVRELLDDVAAGTSDYDRNAWTMGKLHLMLAAAYADDHRWDGTTENTAIGQALRAVDVFDRQLGLMRSELMIGNAHGLLAYAFQQIGCFGEAAAHYLLAAKAYAKGERWGAVDAMLNAVATMPVAIPRETYPDFAATSAMVEQARLHGTSWNARDSEALTGWIMADPELTGSDLRVLRGDVTLQIVGTATSTAARNHLAAVVARWPDHRSVGLSISVIPRNTDAAMP